MEESPTPWVIAEAVKARVIPTLWVWVFTLSGGAAVLVGGVLYSMG